MNRSATCRRAFSFRIQLCPIGLTVFADDLKFSKELAQKLAAGFGGGMGKQQETCGAVTGAIMVSGIAER